MTINRTDNYSLKNTLDISEVVALKNSEFSNKFYLFHKNTKIINLPESKYLFVYIKRILWNGIGVPYIDNKSFKIHENEKINNCTYTLIGFVVHNGNYFENINNGKTELMSGGHYSVYVKYESWYYYSDNHVTNNNDAEVKKILSSTYDISINIPYILLYKIERS